MNDQRGEPDDRELGQRLRHDVDGPEFSPQLHRRIMGALRSAPAGGHDERRRVAPRLGWAVAGAAVAAAIVVGVLLKPAGPSGPSTGLPSAQLGAGRAGGGVGPMPSRETAQIPSLVAVADDLVRPAQRQLEESRFAYLDRDAQTLARYVIDQVNLP